MVKQFIYIFLLVAILTIALYLVYVELIDEWIEGYRAIGTFHDYGDRILGTTDPNVFNANRNIKTIDECNQIAMDRRHPYFGVEWSECHTGFLKKDDAGRYRPLKNTDFYGKRLPNNGTRDAVNESRDFRNGGPVNPYKIEENRTRTERRERPNPKPINWQATNPTQKVNFPS
jgi:hypothetical protein